MLDHGAAGFICKSASPAEIGAAIRQVLDCGSWLPAALADAVAALIGVAFADEPEVVGLEADLARRSDSHGFVAVADGVVVGSAIVALVGKHGADAPEQIRAYIRSLKTAVEAARKEVA